jgi:hypothetical protein
MDIKNITFYIKKSSFKPGSPTWVDIPNDPDGAKVKIRKIEFKSDIDIEEIWDSSILDWKNIYDENGSEIPCTRANKLNLIKESEEFASFINDILGIKLKSFKILIEKLKTR